MAYYDYKDQCGNWNYSDNKTKLEEQEAILNLKKELLDKCEPVSPHFSKTIDKHFWELF
jgi:hypothetical protein